MLIDRWIKDLDLASTVLSTSLGKTFFFCFFLLLFYFLFKYSVLYSQIFILKLNLWQKKKKEAISVVK